MKKGTYLKYLFKSIKDNFSRLLAITIIVLLGTSFIVGLQSSGPDLKETINSYFNETNFHDVSIQSNIGFGDSYEDILRENVSNIKYVEGSYQMDQFVYVGGIKKEGRIIAKDFSDSNIDELKIIEGRMPRNNEECVALKTYFGDDTEISDVIRIDDESYRVVGIVEDPAYLSHNPETTLIGSGQLDTIFYLNSEFLPEDSDYLNTTIVKISFYKNKDIESTFDDEYDEFIDKKVDEIVETSALLLEDAFKYHNIQEEIEKEVDEALTDYAREYIKELFPDWTDEQVESVIPIAKEMDEFKNMFKEQVEQAIEDLNMSTFILTRNENQGYSTFDIDVDKVIQLSTVFPIFFYGIALLVSITSITRLVNKDRGQIGTLKSLGYSRLKIYNKYLFYGLLTSILGAILGLSVGLFVLPTVIANMYGTLYNISNIVYTFNLGGILISSLVMIALIVLTVTIISYSVLKENSASLLIPKAPKAGKKILLERIAFFWRHIKFKTKSMLRNVFTFKKNLIMMIIGIGGCVGILLTAFGLQDSLSTINNEQYTNIIKYDFIATTDNLEEAEKLFDEDDFDKISSLYYEAEVNIHPTYSSHYQPNKDVDVYLMGGADSLNGFVGFDESVEFNDNSVVISKQISKYLKLKVGDLIYINVTPSLVELNSSASTYEYNNIALRISGITSNYINNYVYIGKNVYENRFKELSVNSLLIDSSLSDDDLDDFASRISENENITSLSTTYASRNIYKNILDNLTSIIVLVVLLAGALIFVVIYNLVDINIDERVKEIATLRVNGYTKKETLLYIFKEIIFMSVIAILIGLGFGVLLHLFVISTISSPGLMFGETIFYYSYLYTIGLVIIFIAITALIFIPKITKIKMNEVLKSVD